MWLCDYKYNDENTINYVVMNKVSLQFILSASTALDDCPLIQVLCLRMWLSLSLLPSVRECVHKHALLVDQA